MEAIPYSEVFLCLLILAQQIQGIFNRRSSDKREKELIQAVLARNLPEYAASLETAPERIKHMNAESKLAKEATKLEREMNKDSTSDYGPIPIR